MDSAVHHEGQRLYELARQGVEVERSAREVVVASMVVEEIDGPAATLRIVCGKGTYIRALAADLGTALGCGAAVERLTRTRVGPFTLRAALDWQALVDGLRDALRARLLPMDAGLADWPVARLDDEGVRHFCHGQPARLGQPLAAARFVRVYDERETLLGVGETASGGGSVRPVRMLHADRPGTSARPA
jgi:tRNA pseudouridine55 synthase